eukprot:7165366-Prymnesium_polylepis.1
MSAGGTLPGLPHMPSATSWAGRSGESVAVSEGAAEAPRFFPTVEDALQLGRRFTIGRLLELAVRGTGRGSG